MRLSEYKAGTILVDGDGKVFIHDGFVNADGYGVIIGEDSDGMIQKSNGIGNWMKGGCWREATSQEVSEFFAKVRKNAEDYQLLRRVKEENMAGMEFGKCDICGKEAALSRTYFKYRIGSCECCRSKLRDGSNGHFEVVHHCNKCVPHLPTVIHPLFKALDGKAYRANITNVLPFEIEGKFIIEEPAIKEDEQ